MKNVRLAMAVMVLAITGSMAMAAGKGWELSGAGDYLSPGNKDIWKNGAGCSLEGKYWFGDHLGLGMSAGYESWKMSGDWSEVNRSYFGYGYALGFDAALNGKASVIPVGLSCLYRMNPAKKVKVTLEGGAKYLFVSAKGDWTSQAHFVNDWMGLSETAPTKDAGTVSIGNSAVAFLGANVDFMLTDSVSLFAGAGYQIDIIKGDIKLENWDSRIDFPGVMKDEFKAVYGQVGVSVTL